ncbi:hypothetical protein H2198_006454 [Neophaeococcomyces mojaviensis]|uniref:Uncharacterized protein n=1 Tax=Neophaeococcomyces mojaviensis TaxID=3383035 RepID=A0ACC3A3H8_9EURO|nr:hypothetical protein H2198_006454 [Knufia sp. JES_112]
MTEKADIEKLAIGSEPRLTRSYCLNFIGDWGQANFHRICGWLTQEFCDRAGPSSRVATWSIRGGGIEALSLVHQGEAQLAVATPTALMQHALTGKAIFKEPMPGLRGLAVLPQNDRMVLAIDPKHGINSFGELRRAKLPLKIATSTDDGTNFIGYVARKFMEAHGIPESELKSWGGQYLTYHRPEQCIALIEKGEADGVLQEAIMTPWWAKIIENGSVVPIPAEIPALKSLTKLLGMSASSLPDGFWSNLEVELPALDFSDFVIFVRDDMPEKVAHLITWCLVETRSTIENQYKHLPPSRSPLSYPLVPEKMAKTPFPLHPGAERYYREAGYL